MKRRENVVFFVLFLVRRVVNQPRFRRNGSMARVKKKIRIYGYGGKKKFKNSALD